MYHCDVLIRAVKKLPQECQISENMRRLPNVRSSLGQRLRRWPSNEPTLGKRLVFDLISSSVWIHQYAKQPMLFRLMVILLYRGVYVERMTFIIAYIFIIKVIYLYLFCKFLRFPGCFLLLFIIICSYFIFSFGAGNIYYVFILFMLVLFVLKTFI